MIKATNISKFYGNTKAVDNISFSIHKGEIFCFLGPNGAGKTTTLKLLTGLSKPSSGKILINNIDIVKDPMKAKKIMGYIPDTPYIYEKLTAWEFLSFVGNVYSIDKNYIEQESTNLLNTFELYKYKDSLISEFSHGMRQKLIFCATFLHNPKVLFVDEPLVGLDPKTIRLIKDILIKKADSGTTIFLTTHILPLAEDIAQRIAIINKGKILKIASLQELKSLYGKNNNLEEIFLKLTNNK